VLICTLLTLGYALLIGSGVGGFRLATFAYVTMVGAVLTHFDRSKLEILLIVAVVMSGGTYYLFTQVFSLVLP